MANLFQLLLAQIHPRQGRPAGEPERAELVNVWSSSAAGRERGKSARVSVNWQQAVLRFDYVEAGSAPEASVVMEEANEGEKE